MRTLAAAGVRAISLRYQATQADRFGNLRSDGTRAPGGGMTETATSARLVMLGKQCTARTSGVPFYIANAERATTQGRLGWSAATSRSSPVTKSHLSSSASAT